MMPIKVMIAGEAGPSVVVPAGSYATTTNGSGASCDITFESDGDYAVFSDISPTGKWLLGSVLGSLYEIRWTNSIGTLSYGGPAGSWLALSSNQVFGVSQATVGSKVCVATVEIRLASSGIVQASGSITIEANRDS